MVSRKKNDNNDEKIIIIMMPDNALHKGEFIVRIVFLCIKSQNSVLKIEGSLNSEYWVPHLKID